MKRALRTMRRIIENHYSGGWGLDLGRWLLMRDQRVSICAVSCRVYTWARIPTWGPRMMTVGHHGAGSQGWVIPKSLARFTPFNPHSKPTEWVLFSSPSHRGGSWDLVCSQEGRVCSGFIAGTRNIDVLHLYCSLSFCVDKWNPRKWVQTLLLDFLFSLRGQDWEGSYDLPLAQGTCPARGGLGA